ncbi:MAG TPA: YheU family protein [Gammaproteobacteria bacterium]|nr:YheU family protein [Gammaproteobacteria bacterium]
MIIPHQNIAPDTLQTLVEEFVTRSGTDYGSSEASLAEKVSEVLCQLGNGEAVIVYDPALESCNITTAAQARQHLTPETRP